VEKISRNKLIEIVNNHGFRTEVTVNYCVLEVIERIIKNTVIREFLQKYSKYYTLIDAVEEYSSPVYKPLFGGEYYSPPDIAKVTFEFETPAVFDVVEITFKRTENRGFVKQIEVKQQRYEMHFGGYLSNCIIKKIEKIPNSGGQLVLSKISEELKIATNEAIHETYGCPVSKLKNLDWNTWRFYHFENIKNLISVNYLSYMKNNGKEVKPVLLINSNDFSDVFKDINDMNAISRVYDLYTGVCKKGDSGLELINSNSRFSSFLSEIRKQEFGLIGPLGINDELTESRSAAFAINRKR